MTNNSDGGEPGSPATILVLSADPVIQRAVSSVAKAQTMTVTTARAEVDDLGPIVAVVIDLEQAGSIDEVEAQRRSHPDALLVGHVSMPDPERWVAAERAGCDLVANRGAVKRQLRALLAAGTRRRRFPLCSSRDVAGRLGLVMAVDDTPLGPLGVYQVDGEVTAVGDVCPHQGGRLSTGEVAGCVVTCPIHGSQFDVATGERLRGPSDEPIPVGEVVIESGRVQLMWIDSAGPRS